LVTAQEKTGQKFTGNTAKRGELIPALLFFAVLFSVKALETFLLYRAGYLEFDGDGFTRSLRAWEWLQYPRFEVDAWLPLQFWLNGLLMNFWPDLFWEPRVVNMLASLVTTGHAFLLGRWLFGRACGYATALLVGLFPWEIRFGFSGMAESLTYMFLMIGIAWFVRWLYNSRYTYLFYASLGFLGATMLRYEAWFYSLVFAGIVLFVAWRNIRLEWKLLLPLALTFSFAIIWALASWLQFGKPWAFVSITSEINSNLAGDQNRAADFLSRLLFYPRILFNLLPWLVLLGIAGSIWLFWRASPVRYYLTLVWGQFALFILSTLPTNNIAPGSARYPVSNLLLLLPVVAWLLIEVAKITGRWLNIRQAVTVVGVTLVLGVAALFTLTTYQNPSAYPDGDVRQVALWFKEQTEKDNLPSNEVIPVHFPNPKAENGGDYAYIYALSVLTNRPDGLRFPSSEAKGLRVISEISGFSQTVVDDKPLAWVHIRTADDEETINELKSRYRSSAVYGTFLIVYEPLNRPLSVTPSQGNVNQSYTFTGEGFQPGETVSLWVSWQDKSRALPAITADDRGRITVTYKPELVVTQSLTARGSQSGRQGSAEIMVNP
jgi:4-amino-4-deoxy-L-arabinose transferase-like glycosyltransferase